MGIVQTLMSGIERRGHNKPIQWSDSRLVDLLGGWAPTLSGVNVTEDSAMRLSVVYACVDIISTTVGMLPTITYERLDNGGRERATNHRVHDLLHRRPNPEIGPARFKTASQSHILTRGNSYSEIEFDGRGNPVALWILPPNRVKPKRTDDDRLYYELTLPDETRILAPEQVLHIAGMGFDGLQGYNPIRMAREAIALGLAAEEFGARFFSQGTNIGGVATHPNKLSEAAWKRLKEDLESKYAGLGKSHRLMLLEEGMEFQSIGIPPDDAQFLQTREFQIAEIARIFKVPLHLLQEHQKSTSWGSGLEELNQGLITYTLGPWLKFWEEEINFKLFTRNEQARYYVEFLVDGLLRGDAKTRSEVYQSGVSYGRWSINEVRAKENENPIPGGDTHFVPVNVVPLEVAIKAGEDSDEGERARRIIRELQGVREPQKKTGREAALARSRIAKRHERIFEDATGRLVWKEKRDVLRAAKKYLGERNLPEFEDWVNDYYEDFAEEVRRQFDAPIVTLADAIVEVASAELDEDPPDISEQVEEYQDTQADRYVRSSRAQVLGVASDALEDGIDAVEAIDERLTHWEEVRPGQVAMRETVQESNFIARATFASLGVTKLMWSAIGADSCEICQEMDGRIVGINSPFVGSGDVLDSESQNPMRIFKPTRHPPIHRGCVCSVEPV